MGSALTLEESLDLGADLTVHPNGGGAEWLYPPGFDTFKPWVYIACLSAYNDGKLHGVFINVDEDFDADEAERLVEVMLSRSPVPLAEEYELHDHSDMSGIYCELYGADWERLEAYGRAYERWQGETANIVTAATLADPERDLDEVEVMVYDSLEELGRAYLYDFGPSVEGTSRRHPEGVLLNLSSVKVAGLYLTSLLSTHEVGRRIAETSSNIINYEGKYYELS